MPQTSDDSSHDDALANRIAALNMLDLGWQHLGVEIDTANPTSSQGIDEVVTACGKGSHTSNSLTSHRHPLMRIDCRAAKASRCRMQVSTS